MQLTPDTTELLARTRSDLRMGLPVVIIDGQVSALVLAAETLNADRLKQIQQHGGDIILAITARRSATLKITAYDNDLARVLLPENAALNWVYAIANPADDLKIPLKGPLKSIRDGSAVMHRTAINLVKTARLLPAVLVLEIENGAGFANANNLTQIDLQSAKTTLERNIALNPVISARLPLAVSESGRLHIFRAADGGEDHFAVEIGKRERQKPLLVRLHSACFTGDLLGSLKCDCGPQLRASLAQMGQEGAGVLLYLNQEGRGIGLANKMRAYQLQDQGFDTVEANHRLGFEDDERDFRIGANILKKLGISQVRLLTNNPEKVKMLQSEGITVCERVPLKVGQTPQNAEYLKTKAAKSGHLL